MCALVAQGWWRGSWGDFREFTLQLAVFLHNSIFCVLFLLLDIWCVEMVDDISQALAKLHYYDGISGPKPNSGSLL